MNETAYSNYEDWKGWTGRGFAQCDPASALYYEAEMASAGLLPLSDQSLLEIGCGSGEFAVWGVEKGARYFGTERIAALVAAGCEAGFRVYSSDDDLVEILGVGSLDAVVAFDVFEHIEIEDLQKLLGTLGRCLKPGGRVVARVPSGDSPFSRAIQYGDITHKVVIGSSAVRQIAGRCGFEVLQVREPAFPLRGRGIVSVLRRAMVAAARAAVFPILRTVFLGNRQAVLTPNMVFVLRKPA